MYKYNFSISLPGIEADSLQEAEKKAYAMLNDLAGSNDGSEFLANAQINYRGCTNAKPYTSGVEESNCGASNCCEPQTSLQPPNCTNVPW